MCVCVSEWVWVSVRLKSLSFLLLMLLSLCYVCRLPCYVMLCFVWLCFALHRTGTHKRKTFYALSIHLTVTKLYRVEVRVCIRCVCVYICLEYHLCHLWTITILFIRLLAVWLLHVLINLLFILHFKLSVSVSIPLWIDKKKINKRNKKPKVLQHGSKWKKNQPIY